MDRMAPLSASFRLLLGFFMTAFLSSGAAEWKRDLRKNVISGQLL
jgi:hypothetical protein